MKKREIPGDTLISKLTRLEEILSSLKRVAVAYSGGVDSTFLLKVSYDTLNGDAIGIYIDSPLQPEREKQEALENAKKIGAEVLIVEVTPLSSEDIMKNPPNRCYHCKGLIFGEIVKAAALNGFTHVIDGSNKDDLSDFRPGKLALKERNIRSPLQEAGFAKGEIRMLSRIMKLPTWEKDSYACLASRIPYNSVITAEKLIQVDKVEQLLINNHFRNVRARHMKDRVRIEVRSDQVGRLNEMLKSEEFNRAILEAGFIGVEVDPLGYKQGNLNKGMN